MVDVKLALFELSIIFVVKFTEKYTLVEGSFNQALYIINLFLMFRGIYLGNVWKNLDLNCLKSKDSARKPPQK